MLFVHLFLMGQKSIIQDKLRMLRSVSALKLVNAFALYSSYHYSRVSKKNYHRGLPMAISIEPTTACNLGCPECPSGLKQFTRPTGNLQAELFHNLLNQLSSHLMYLTFYFQGEPFINPNLSEMIKKASEKGIYTATSTNAHFLTDAKAKEVVESGLSRLIISIDGTTQEVYEAYRKKGSLKKVIEGTENIMHWKRELKSKTPHVIFQYLVVKPNEHQLDDVKKLAKKLGVDEVKFKTAQVYDYVHGNPLIPDNPKYSRYKLQADGTYAIKNKLVNQCWKMWHSCVVTFNGSVVPCCFDKDAHHKLGELKEIKFRDIWRNEAYQNFRQALLVSRNEIDICKNCSEGTKVWA